MIAGSRAKTFTHLLKRAHGPMPVVRARYNQERLTCKMNGLMNEEIGALITAEAVVRENCYRADGANQGCKPLWLTRREAESLLVLCAASPVSVGPGEQDLFMKLGDFFRSTRR